MTAAKQADTMATALLALQSQLPVVKRNTLGQVGPRPYKYADLGDVWAAIQPILQTLGLVYTVQPRQAERGEHYEIVGSLMHSPSGEIISAAIPLTGGTMPQQIGSALTYARRYLLACLTGLITDEDIDGAGASDGPATQGDRVGSQAAQEAERALLEAQDAVGNNLVAGGHAPQWDLAIAQQQWRRWGQVAGDIMDANADQLSTFAKWLVSAGHANQEGAKP